METPNEHRPFSTDPPYPGNANPSRIPPPKVVPEVVPEEPAPQEVIKEEDDKPAGNTIKWTIAIAIVILAIIYFLFFYESGNEVAQIQLSAIKFKF